jgi:outer membrane protein
MSSTMLGRRLLCALLLCHSYPLMADQVSDLTEVYTASGVPGQDRAPPPGFHGVLGAGLFNFKKIVGDADRKTVALPIVALTYGDQAYWSLGGGGVWLSSTDRSLRLGVGVKLHAGWKQNGDALLVGMEDRDASLDGSVNLMWRLPAVNIGLNYYHDLLDVSDGSSVTLRLSRNLWLDPRLRVTPSAGLAWQSAELVDYYYGVRAGEALPSRHAYEGRGTVNVSLGVTAAYLMSREWSLLGGLHITHLGNGIADSPIVPDPSTSLLFFGAGWHF